MSHTKKGERQSLSIHEGIRKASFVPIDSKDTKKFKYNSFLLISKYFKNHSLKFKEKINKSWQTPKRWVQEVDWKKINVDFLTWFLEVLIEGFIANFVTHFLFNVDFGVMMVIAHGFLIKQSISVYWQFRGNGSTATIPKKDN